MADTQTTRYLSVLKSITSVFFLFLIATIVTEWLSSDTFSLRTPMVYAVTMTGIVCIPVLVILKQAAPVLHKETKEKRVEAFRENHVGYKMVTYATVLLSLLIIGFWYLSPLLRDISFTTILAASMGIGLALSILSAGIARYIIQLDRPPGEKGDAT